MPVFSRIASRRGIRLFASHVALVAAYCFLPLTGPVCAQTPAPAKVNASSAPVIKKPKSDAGVSKPNWQELTAAQQTSLKPLAANWNSLSEPQKRKWLAVAKNYPNLAPQEQVKMHSRMTEWVSLSQQQRSQARLNFAQSRDLTPSQKTNNWKAYQELSPDEKQKLASSAAPKSGGAATAAKPVPQQKLVAVPVARKTSKAEPKMTAASQPVNRNTLLPQSPAAPTATASGKD